MSLFKRLFFILALTSTTLSNANQADGAILEATLDILPSKVTTENPRLITPGIPAKIAVKIKNVGSKVNQPATLYVRFSFPRPLDNQKNSTLFATEAVSLPPINPGQSAALEFETEQATPSLNDFIREDWSLRQYQAVVVLDKQEYVIGSIPLTFSCFYYPGQGHETPVTIPALEAPLH